MDEKSSDSTNLIFHLPFASSRARWQSMNHAQLLKVYNDFQRAGTFSDVDRQIAVLMKGHRLFESEVIELCDKAIKILAAEDNVPNIAPPVTICGDIHGQLFDLVELFHVGGPLPNTNYVFLGDYVDRGLHSVETFQLLIALKVRYPDRVTLIRGNHEVRHITEVYGFYEECMVKYSSAIVWRKCCDVFAFLCLGAVVGGKIFCVHGGLSPEIETIDQIRTSINRQQQMPYGPAKDLLWSDPDDNNHGWLPNPRGAGYLFGADATGDFCHRNDIDLICRAHQLVMNGFQSHFDNTLLTIFSAPNYCYRCGNSAAILLIDEQLNQRLTTFDASPYSSSECNWADVARKVPDYFI